MRLLLGGLSIVSGRFLHRLRDECHHNLFLLARHATQQCDIRCAIGVSLIRCANAVIILTCLVSGCKFTNKSRNGKQQDDRFFHKSS